MEEVIESDKFKRLSYPKTVETNGIVLTKEEVKMIIQYEPIKEKLKKVKDLFLVLIYNGLRFGDGIRISKSWVKDDSLIIRTQKTDDKISIPLHPILNELLRKYDYDLTPLRITNQ